MNDPKLTPGMMADQNAAFGEPSRLVRTEALHPDANTVVVQSQNIGAETGKQSGSVATRPGQYSSGVEEFGPASQVWHEDPGEYATRQGFSGFRHTPRTDAEAPPREAGVGYARDISAEMNTLDASSPLSRTQFLSAEDLYSTQRPGPHSMSPAEAMRSHMNAKGVGLYGAKVDDPDRIAPGNPAEAPPVGMTADDRDWRDEQRIPNL